jgi:hypothetical protein
MTYGGGVTLHHGAVEQRDPIAEPLFQRNQVGSDVRA